MNRDEFFGKLSALDEERLKKALWNLYWRGSAPMRERIEAELTPEEHAQRRREAAAPPDPEEVLFDVEQLIELARSGAYIGGDRSVTPRERTRWRFAVQHLVRDAQHALRADIAGAVAMEQLVDFACEMKDYEYFRSDDPVEAARFVVSDSVHLLWLRLRDERGFDDFAQSAASQLVRWESAHGWTRTGFGKVSEKESSLASILPGMLPTPEQWIEFTDRYLGALDEVAAGSLKGRDRSARDSNWERAERTRNLAEWNLMLLEKLGGYGADDRLDRLTSHPALGGPRLTYLQARLAYQRGSVDEARKRIYKSLESLPGHQGFLDFAASIDAPLPPTAERAARERRESRELLQ